MLGKILLVFMLVGGQAAQSNGVIRGQILIPSARASERIQVIVQRADGPVVARVFSDSLGNYEVRNLVSGNYDVIVNVEGYEEVRQQVGVAGGGIFNSVTANIALIEKEKTIIVKPDGGAADDIVDVTELGRKYPRKAAQDYEKALEEVRKTNDAKAVELLEGVVKLAPDFYSAHNTLGTLYQKSNRYRDAEAEYRRARQLNPRAADPLVNLGSLFIEEASSRASEGEEIAGKILDSALDILEESLKLKRSATAYYFLGTAYYKSTFYEEAETNLKRALEFDPHMPSARLMLANLYIKQQKWPTALEHLDAYLAENPKALDRAQIQETRTKVAQRIK
jgi:Tfp pilus assembly protein PilF